MICLSGAPVAMRQFAAVLVFGRVAASAGDFHAHGAVRRLHLDPGARLHAALGGIDAQAKRGGLGEDELRQVLAILGLGDDAQQGAGAVLLHLERRHA